MPGQPRKSATRTRKPQTAEGARKAAAATRNPYAATAWGKEVYCDLEVPSGQLCQVRRPGVEGLIKAGLLHDLDLLTNVVQTEHIEAAKGRGKPKTSIDQVNLQMLRDNPGMVEKALGMIDRVVEYVVVQPDVLRPVLRDDSGKPILHEETGEEIALAEDQRVPGQIYTDLIDLTDRVFIMQFVVGGSADLATFREEFSELLGGLEAFPAL